MSTIREKSENESNDFLDLMLADDDLSDVYIDKSWQRDLYVITAVETGNKQMIEKLEESFPTTGVNEHFYGNPVIEDDRLRERKNGLIMRNVLCRIGAGRGGVPPRYLHRMSEKYILLIERQTNAEVLIDTISPMMIDEYIDLVNQLSVSNYSNLIKSVVIYISGNIQEPLSLSNIAEKFYVNSSHLSREFKKETGDNITDYINKQKIDLAKLFLIQNNNSIMEVSELLSYNSSSYFSKLFKKITGMSPKEYKNDFLSE